MITKEQYKECTRCERWMETLLLFEKYPIVPEDGDLETIERIHKVLFELTGNKRGFLEESAVNGDLTAKEEYHGR
jgi:hypothetical protein